MPYSTPLASRCCRRMSSRSEPGGPASGNASSAHARRHHARPGQLPRQALPQMLAEGRHVLAPARRQERMQVRRRAIAPDGCRNRRSSSCCDAPACCEPERSSHVPPGLRRHYRARLVGDRPVAQARIGLERVVDQNLRQSIVRKARPAARRRRRNASADSRSRTAACGRSRCAPACARAVADRPSARRPAASVKRTCSRMMLRRRPVDPRHLRPHAAPGLVGPPQQRRQPGEARFDQHQLERGELLEHALGEEAQQLRFERRRLRDVILHPVRRPARRGRRMAIGAAGVNADREPVLFGRRIDRPIGAAAEQHLAHGKQQHLHEAAVGREPLDLRAPPAPGLCAGSRIDARRRGSRSSSSFAIQSFTAAHSAAAMSSLNSATAPCSTLQMAKRVPKGSSACRRIASRSPPGSPDVCRQSGRALSGEFGG